jgi:hypothetical protein
VGPHPLRQLLVDLRRRLDVEDHVGNPLAGHGDDPALVAHEVELDRPPPGRVDPARGEAVRAARLLVDGGDHRPRHSEHAFELVEEAAGRLPSAPSEREGGREPEMDSASRRRSDASRSASTTRGAAETSRGRLPIE